MSGAAAVTCENAHGHALAATTWQFQLSQHDNDSSRVVCVVATEAVWQAWCYCACASTLASTGTLAQSDTAAQWSVSVPAAWGWLQSGSPARLYARTAVPTRQSSAASFNAAGTAASLGWSAGFRASSARLWWIPEKSSDCTVWEMMLHLL